MIEDLHEQLLRRCYATVQGVVDRSQGQLTKLTEDEQFAVAYLMAIPTSQTYANGVLTIITAPCIVGFDGQRFTVTIGPEL
ncbi:MAG: hypothetical protein WC455_11200 [Dehalococcoidia bacterium]|jgi:hypothetical protein